MLWRLKLIQWVLKWLKLLWNVIGVKPMIAHGCIMAKLIAYFALNAIADTTTTSFKSTSPASKLLFMPLFWVHWTCGVGFSCFETWEEEIIWTLNTSGCFDVDRSSIIPCMSNFKRKKITLFWGEGPNERRKLFLYQPIYRLIWSRQQAQQKHHMHYRKIHSVWKVCFALMCFFHIIYSFWRIY